MENKVVCVTKADKDTTDLVIKPNYTTNKNYLGHNQQGIPYYYDSHLKQGEIKYIMANEEFKKLPAGRYECRVEQAITKMGKDEKGDEDPSKKVIVLELNVKDHNEGFYYMNFCIEGYGEEQMKYAREQLDKLLKEFKVISVEQLQGLEGILTVKEKEDGKTNMYFNSKANFYDWNTYEGFKYTDEVKVPGVLKKFYRGSVGNKYIFMVDINGHMEFIPYDLDREWEGQNIGLSQFNNVMNKLSLTPEQAGQDISKNVTVRIKKSKNGIFFKNIYFERKVRTAGKW